MPGPEPAVSLLITAEHARHAIPARWTQRFSAPPDVLRSHRGWDPGSLPLARALSRALKAELMTGRWSRLLVDLNRSEHHPRRFSEFARELSGHERDELTDTVWRPHWRTYAEFIQRAPGRVVHLACHSFTPELDGKIRPTDIGLLHDPARRAEDAFCRRLQSAIRARASGLDVHRNRPYRGTSDGIGSWHRKCFGEDKLISLEIELNQRFAAGPGAFRIREMMVQAVRESLTIVSSLS
ncbi:MAG: N-formylglutamate amidohydrolase [Wenzhouxiangella sp.]|jgi:predicted N-formylglutamate amidohydrolase|nr:N-formylglutamate amidohydrolase [Wenzhouxiangella sp.]